MEYRVNQLKAMHALILTGNDESIYDRWINLVPDGPCEEDFQDIAEDEEQLAGVKKLFARLIALPDFYA